MMVARIESTISEDSHIFLPIVNKPLPPNWMLLFKSQTDGVDISLVDNLEDGRYSLFGNISGSLLNIKLASNGQIDAYRLHGFACNWPGVQIDTTPDRGYIVVCKRGPDLINLAKLSADHLIEWQKTYGFFSSSIPTVHSSTAGDFIIGLVSPNYGATENLILIKVKSNGSIDWSKLIGTEDDDEAYSIAGTDDGGAILAGYSTSLGAPNVLFIKLTSEGNVAWQKAHIPKNFEAGCWDMVVSERKAGGFIAVGRGRDTVCMMRLNKNGELIWVKHYGIDHNFDSGLFHLANIVHTNDGMVAIETGGTKAQWLKIDGDGHVIWYRSYPEYTAQWLGSASDNNLLISGYAYDDLLGYQIAFAARTLSDGHFPGCPSSAPKPTVVAESFSTVGTNLKTNDLVVQEIESPQYSWQEINITWELGCLDGRTSCK
jgi:hypothetical protein